VNHVWTRSLEFVPVTADFDSFYRAEVLGQVRRAALLVGSDDAANDIVQEAFANMYRRWKGSTIPRRICVERSMDAATAPAAANDTFGPVTDEREIVTDLLGRLPINQRAAVVLRFYVGYSTDEIAAALGCPRGSVGPWIERALNSMRKELP
jgi:DNA-directed RNA polymerase specialized sigma24 family protein